MKLSIIIPAYNAQDTIEKCILSIIKQNANPEDYEVIVVDDCSTDFTLSKITAIATKFTPPPYNIHIIKQLSNNRQGAARNKGVAVAQGRYIQYLDADDYLVDGALPKLLRETELSECDMIMYDSETRTVNGKLTGRDHYNHNSREIMNGEDYLQKCEVPWVPWLSLISKKFIVKHDLRFAEGVRFEDTDYMLKSYLLADSVVYRPITAVCHVVNPNSTVFIGNDYQKITETMMSPWRLKKTIDMFGDSHRHGVEVLRNHYVFQYNNLVAKTLWRLPADKIVNLLRRFPFQLKTDCLARKASDHPYVYAVMAQLAKPLLLSAIFLRNKFRSVSLK